MMKDMNIAIIVQSLSGGGAERVAGLLSKYLSAHYNVYIFLCNPQNIQYEYQGKIVGIDEKKGIYSELRRKKKEYNIDCAISFGGMINIANIRTRVTEKVIVSHHNSTGIRQGEVPFVKEYYPYADVIVTCSEGVRLLLIKYAGIDPHRVISIYNFIIDNNSSSSINNFDYREERIADYEPFVMSTGRYTWEKNQLELIEQYVFFHNHYTKNLSLLIIGEGQLEGQLKKRINDLGASDYIKLVPFTDIVPYYKKAKAFLMTSVTEGLPNVIFEAMRYGVPVISTDCFCGPREQLDDECTYETKICGYKIAKRGILVQLENEESVEKTHFFADAIYKLLSDKTLLEEIKKNIQRYISNYSNDDIVNKWKKVIDAPIIKTADIRRIEIEYEKALDNCSAIIIYGAGVYGKRVLNVVNDGKHKVLFAVSDSPIEGTIDGFEIKSINDLLEYKDDGVVLIAAMREKMHTTMLKTAQKLGFRNIYLPHM